MPAFGGTYIEGIVGQPRFINPVYGETNDIDRSLIDLTFSGLMTYDNKTNLVKDLASDYKVSDDGKTYDFTLKNNIFWHDGYPLTSDDIIFTIKTIQNSDYKSPLRANWIDVDVKKNSDTSLTFTLKAPYSSFLENCTLKIIPKHIWQNISPENFIFSSYNLQPVGSGPFRFTNVSETGAGFIKSISFESNRRYYNTPSLISNLTFKFFEKKEDLIKAANSKEIQGLTLASIDNNEATAEKEIRQTWQSNEKFSVYYFSLPRYFAVFFNPSMGSGQGGQKSIFSDANIRKAFIYSVNKEELVKQIRSQTKNNISIVDSPILPEFFGYQNPSIAYNFDIDKSKKLLDKAGFKDNGQNQRQKAIDKKPAFQFKKYLKMGSKGKDVGQLQACLARLDNSIKDILKNETNGTFAASTDSAVTEFQKKYLPDKKPTGETGGATRDKLNEVCFAQQDNFQPLKFTLTTINQPQLLEVANLLKNYWQSIGTSVDINAVSIGDLKPIIKNRNYDALLYGQALGAEPDFYPFWHSSQKIDPGLNFSSYENKDTDKLLKDSRENLDDAKKEQKLEKMQNIILDDAPALFLYNPDYVYWVSNSIQGIDTAKIIDPAKRFSNITNWYLQTRRVGK